MFGPLLGALVVKSFGEGAKLIAGDAPGLDLIAYGSALVLVIAFAPRGVIGAIADARKWIMRSSTSSRSSAREAGHG